MLLASSPRSAEACAIRSHHWRIVLGETDAGVVVLDLPLHTEEKEVPCKLGQRGCDKGFDDLFVGSKGPSKHGTRLSVTWKGSASLTLFTQNGRKLRHLAQVAKVDQPWVWPDLDPKRLLASALKRATKLAGFRAYALPVQDFCDYSRTCGRYELSSDDKGVLSVQVESPGVGKVSYPVALSSEFLSRVSDGDDPVAEVVRHLRIMSVLSYANAKGELLVIDLGFGDEVQGAGSAALYPPCGCTDITQCPPWPGTLHHGEQMQAIVQVPVAAPPRPRVEQPARPPLTLDDLLQARRQATWPPRSDGVYITEPTCEAKQGWKRTALRVFGDGTVSLVDGNFSPTDAARVIAAGSSRSPKPCEIQGATTKCLLLSQQDDDAIPSITLDGRWDREWLDIRVLGKATPSPAFHSMRFVPIDKEILVELDKR